MQRLAKAAALLALCGTPAAGQDWLLGSWCSADGQMMFVETDALYFNEHTACFWPVAPDQPPLISPLYCKNVYLQDDDTVVEEFHQTMIIAIEPTKSDTVQVTIGEDSSAWMRCQ